MKKYLFAVLLVSVVLFHFSIAYAQSGIEPYEIERAGQSGWQFLKINGDARQAAMGGAFTALSDGDANSTFGNPAAITNVQNIDIAFNRTNWIADIGYNAFSIVKNIDGIGAFAFHLANVDYGDIPETINSPIEGEGRTLAVITGRMFTASDISVGISYAREISDQLSIGGSIKWIRESIDEVSMTNLAFDLGTLFYTGFKSLRIALVARNFGPDSRFFGFSEEYQSEPVDVKMPLDFRFGVAMDFLDDPGSQHLITFSLDGDHPNDTREKIMLGAEYTFNKMFSVRAGYKLNYDEERFTAGLGINYPVSDYNLKVQYAYVDFGDLERVHMFTIGFSFN